VAESTTYEEENARAGDADAWRADLDYWRRHHPAAHLNWEQNMHITSRLLRIPWTGGPGELPPLVNLEILPRKKPLPKNASPDAIIGDIGTLALSAIPVVGGVLAAVATAGIAYGQYQFAKDWAKQMRRVPPDAFAPRYYPQAFTVPLPLDRAQFIAKNPWLAPAMVDQFVKEWQVGNIGTLDEAVNEILNTQELQGAFGDLPAQRQTGLGANVPRGTMSGGASSSGIWMVLGLAAVTGLVIWKFKRKRR
jgi:hypothetical protein